MKQSNLEKLDRVLITLFDYEMSGQNVSLTLVQAIETLKEILHDERNNR